MAGKKGGTTALALSRARSIAREHKDEAEIEMGNLGAAAVIGMMERAGTMAAVPTFFGLPRTVTLAIVARIASKNTSGSASNTLRGISSGAASIAVYQYAKGVTVSGADGGDVSGAPTPEDVRSAARQLERALERA